MNLAEFQAMMGHSSSVMSRNYINMLDEAHKAHVLASGTLALAAPAAYWISTGGADPTGWWLWALTWLQSAASIVYAFLRLDQRVLKETLSRQEKFSKMGRRALMYSGFNLMLALVAGAAGWLSSWLWVPYLLQFAEVVWGISNLPPGGNQPRSASVNWRYLVSSRYFLSCCGSFISNGESINLNADFLGCIY